MSLNKHKTYWMHVVADQSLFHHCIHLWLLFLESSFKAWMLTWTTEHQPTGNLHPSTKLFTVTHAASHFSSFFSTMCGKILRYLRVLARQVAKLLFHVCSSASSPHFKASLLSTLVYIALIVFDCQLHEAFQSGNLEKKITLREHFNFIIVNSKEKKGMTS